MTDNSSFSTEKLIRLAFRYELISDYRMTPFEIELCCTGATYVFDPEEARIFLRGLVIAYEESVALTTIASENRPLVVAAA